MSNEDIKKGIAIQANADAAKVEKLGKGLRALKEILKNIADDQDGIRDTLGIVIEDMSAEEAREIFNLRVKKTPDQLDNTEKRVLCACLYTLLSSYGQSSPSQITLYTSMEKYLGLTERKDDFDFQSLNNIDSHADRMVILKAICSFLFLNTESFSFLFDEDKFFWIFSFATIKDVSDVCSIIKSEFSVLGADGILNYFLLPPSSEREEKEADSSPERKPSSEIVRLEDPFKEDFECYSELRSIVNAFLSDEKTFGKRKVFSEAELAKELSKKHPDISFDAFIAASQIEQGLLIFTTYALYLKAGNIFNKEYVCLPYKDIQATDIATSNSRQSGTRKLLIPVRIGNAVTRVEVDDKKLEEERLRDLLIKINETGCATADTDKQIGVVQLSPEVRSHLISVMIYTLKQAGLTLVDVYIMAEKWGLIETWNEIAIRIKNDDDFDREVEAFISCIPYPSKRFASAQALEIIMGIIAHANTVFGRPYSYLSSETERLIRKLDMNKTSARDFNQLMKQASKEIIDEDYETYSALPDNINPDSAFAEEIIAGAKAVSEKIEKSIGFKAVNAIRKKPKQTACDVQ